MTVLATLGSSMAFGPYPGRDARLSDREIRGALCALFLPGGPHEEGLVVEEVECLRGYVRADYLCIADELAVIEIKSDRDTMARFDEQVRVYNAIADRVTLIVGWNLAARALQRAPYWWHIILAERKEGEETRLVSLRDGRPNPAVDAVAVISMLPLEHVRKLANRVGIHEKLKPQPLRETVARYASSHDLRCAVRDWLTHLSQKRAQPSPPRT